MRHIALIAAALVVPATFAIAQMPAPPGAPDPARVVAGTYAADPSHSLVGFEVNHFGFNAYYGIFGDVAGMLTIDPKNLAAAKVDVTIPVTSVTTASKGLTEHLLRAGKDGGKPDFFGPAPGAARFVSTGVKIDKRNKMEALITGNLTLNGVTKPVTLEAKFVGAGTNPYSKKLTVGFEAEADIKRSDFGLTTGIPFVGDAVELDITVAFEKQ
jgi:polyisoprenoid-binding protein YceI